MAIAYNWAINNTDRLTADNFITMAYWTCRAVDGTYATGAYGSCSFAAGTPTIPYANVTEQEVLDWCWASNLNKDEVEAALAAQIEAKKNPVTANGVPW
jgi:hypothetical protein